MSAANSTPDHKTDHGEEARTLLDWLGHPQDANFGDPRATRVERAALVHSNLAIAEELKDQNHWLEEIANQLSRAQS